MFLKDWLKENGRSQLWLANKLKCHKVTLSGYLNHHTRISKYLAQAISLVTKNEVTVEQLMVDNVSPHLARKPWKKKDSV